MLGQWINQSFNALVNYTNRNAKSETTSWQIFAAYVSATGGAVTAAAGMNAMVKVGEGTIGYLALSTFFHLELMFCIEILIFWFKFDMYINILYI